MAVAAEESAKSKAAKDVIKSLTAQVSLLCPLIIGFVLMNFGNFCLISSAP
jgi:hypothetical protein